MSPVRVLGHGQRGRVRMGAGAGGEHTKTTTTDARSPVLFGLDLTPMSVENDWEPDMSVPFPGSPDDMMNTIAVLRARVAKLEAALTKAQRHIIAIKGHPAYAMAASDLCEIAAALKDAPQ